MGGGWGGWGGLGFNKLSHPYQASKQFQIIKKPKCPIHFTLALFSNVCFQNDLLLAQQGIKLTHMIHETNKRKKESTHK